MVGVTINMVVLFAGIVAVGLLVDGAIVVTELADRKMAEGLHRKYAYTEARQTYGVADHCLYRHHPGGFFADAVLAGPDWPVHAVLPDHPDRHSTASLIMALIVVPSMGTVIGKPGQFNEQTRRDLIAAETGDLNSIGGITGGYIKGMLIAMRHPWRVVGGVTALLISLYAAYGLFGNGLTLFPEVEQSQGSVDIRALGDFSAQEKDRLVRMVEERVYGVPGVENIYVRTGKAQNGAAPDQIGSIRLNFADWRTRRPGAEIMADIRKRVADIPGLQIETRMPEVGPATGKPIDIEVSATDNEVLRRSVGLIRAELETIPGVINAEDTAPLPGIEWQLKVDRAEAAKFGADVTLVGSIIQLVTNGIKLGDYRPDDADEEIDIRVRYPYSDRSLDRLSELRIPTPSGQVPIGTFVTREPVEATRTIMRTDMRRTMLVQSDIEPGAQIEPIVAKLMERLPTLNLDSSVQLRFKGGARDQAETADFLLRAFAFALGLMAMILVTQFNSIFQASLILTAVVFSTGGVMFGLLVTGQSFSLVNCGIGGIALAGIVVNNNIVLIDTYNNIRRTGMRAREAIIRTCAQRLRPVFLTSITTILGLMPMAMAVNIDMINRDVFIGGPGTQWWQQMASAIAGGLLFATLLTLILTPSLLKIQQNVAERWRRRTGKEEEADPAGLATS